MLTGKLKASRMSTMRFMYMSFFVMEEAFKTSVFQNLVTLKSQEAASTN